MKFGVTKEQPLDDSPTIIEEYRKGVIVKRLKHFKEEQKVDNKQQETAAYLKFSEFLSRLRDDNKLAVLKNDPTTIPSFQIKFPKTDIDGSYFIVKQWTEIL